MSSTFRVSYTAKDLILYALSLGMGSTNRDDDELKFLYEHHDEFCAVPTFCLAFTFWVVNVEESNKPGGDGGAVGEGFIVVVDEIGWGIFFSSWASRAFSARSSSVPVKCCKSSGTFPCSPKHA